MFPPMVHRPSPENNGTVVEQLEHDTTQDGVRRQATGHGPNPIHPVDARVSRCPVRVRCARPKHPLAAAGGW